MGDDGGAGFWGAAVVEGGMAEVAEKETRRFAHARVVWKGELGGFAGGNGMGWDKKSLKEQDVGDAGDFGGWIFGWRIPVGCFDLFVLGRWMDGGVFLGAELRGRDTDALMQLLASHLFLQLVQMPIFLIFIQVGNWKSHEALLDANGARVACTLTCV